MPQYQYYTKFSHHEKAAESISENQKGETIANLKEGLIKLPENKTSINTYENDKSKKDWRYL